VAFARETADADLDAGENRECRRVVAEDLSSNVSGRCAQQRDENQAEIEKRSHRVSFMLIIATVTIATGDRDHERVQVVNPDSS
jgi:hypothetical protein